MSKERKYLENALNALIESFENNPSLLREALEEEGYDYRSLIERGGKFTASLRQEYSIMEAKVKHERIEAILRKFQSRLTKFSNREDIIKFLDSLFPDSQGKPAYQAFFHKLKSGDIDSLREIADDAELLKIISDELDNSNER